MTSKQPVGCLNGQGISLGLNLKASLSTGSSKHKIISAHTHTVACKHTCIGGLVASIHHTHIHYQRHTYPYRNDPRTNIRRGFCVHIFKCTHTHSKAQAVTCVLNERGGEHTSGCWQVSGSILPTSVIIT